MLPNWVFNNKEITDVNSFSEGVIGFVYEVSFSDNTKYIGKKLLYHTNTVKKGKKELAAQTDKRLSKKKTVVKESDWKKYYGSIKNKEFMDKVKSGEITITQRNILAVATSKQLLTYYETKYQFVNQVIENNVYRNSNILGKFYTSIFA